MTPRSRNSDRNTEVQGGLVAETLTEENDLDRPLWGAQAIARAINRAPRAAYHLLEKGHLDADRVGGRWVTTPRRLRAQFAGGSCVKPENLRPTKAPASRGRQQ